MTPKADPNKDEYAQVARWYDVEHDVFTDDIAFYLDLAAGTGPLVLEIGCGSGRVTVPLAVAGSQVTGLDASGAMLAGCRSRLRRQPRHVAERVTLLQADARALGEQAPGPFSLAIIPLNTFSHFATLGERLAVLEGAASRLAPGARLVLDVDLEGPRRLLAAPGQLWHMGTWDVATGAADEHGAAEIVSHLVSATRTAEGGLAVTHFYDTVAPSGEVRRSVARMVLAVLTHDEVTLTLERAGFVLEAVYGSYELEPYEAGAERAIFVARTGVAPS